MSEEEAYAKQYVNPTVAGTTTFPTNIPHSWPTEPDGPTDTEIRLREAAIALTIEYFKQQNHVDIHEFDQQLTRFSYFLQYGTMPPIVTAGVNF